MPDLKIARTSLSAETLQYELGLGVYTNMSQEFCDDWFVHARRKPARQYPRSARSTNGTPRR